MGCSSCSKKKKAAIAQSTQTVSGVLPDGAIRMEYIGVNGGSINWRCPSGRSYIGSKHARFIDAYPEDVQFLENTRRWKRVERAVKQVAKNVETAPAPAPDPGAPVEKKPRAAKAKATK